MAEQEIAWQGLLPDGAPVEIVINDRTFRRLQSTCFREGGYAGSFVHWRSLEEVLRNPTVREQLLAEALKVIERNEGTRQRDRGTQEVTLEAGAVIGWGSTTPPLTENRAFRKYWSAIADEVWDTSQPLPPKVRKKVESFQPNNFSIAWCFKKDAGMLAPQTSLLTMHYKIFLEKGRWRIKVRALYPGPNLGRIAGRPSEEKGIIFFYWSNPGDPI
jgi:hypothetical protein